MTDQTTRIKCMEISAAGFAIKANQFIEESISDCKKIARFFKLIDWIESGDVLFVTKLDLLGGIRWISGLRR